MHNFGYAEEGQKDSSGDMHLWRRTLSYCSGHISWIVVAVILSLIVTAATLGLPRLMQAGIDQYIVSATLSSGERVSGIAALTLQYALLVGLVFAGTFVQVILLEWIGQSVMHRMRQHLFRTC